MDRLFKKFRVWLSHASSRRPRRWSVRLGRRRRIGAAVLLALLLVLCGLAWYNLSDERIREHAISAVERFTGGDVELDEANLVVLRQIRIKGLRIYPPGQKRVPQNMVFTADDVILEHQPSSLILGRLRIKQIIADGARLNIRYDLDQRITNLQLLSFLKPRSLTSERPVITVRRGIIEYSEIVNGKSTGRALQEISGQLYPDRRDENIYEFNMNTYSQGIMRESSIVGTFDRKTRRLVTDGKFMLDAIDTTNLPQRLKYLRKLYEIVQPVGELRTKSIFDPRSGHSLSFILKGGKCKLPIGRDKYLLPIENVNANIIYDQEGIIIEELSGRFEDYCDLRLKGTIRGYESSSRFDLSFELPDLEIPREQWQHIADRSADINTSADATAPAVATEPTQPKTDNAVEIVTLRKALDALYEVLPESGRKIINRYQPAGALGFAIRVNGRRDKPERSKWRGKITCSNGAFVYSKFPYPLEAVKGKITFEPNSVIIGPLRTLMDGQEITVEGEYQRQKGQKTYDITVRTRNCPLDEKLYAALGEKRQAIWDRFQPTGFANAVYKQVLKPGQKPCPTLDLTLVDVNACYEGFPVPLKKMSGQAHWNRRRLSFNIDGAKSLGGWVCLKGELDNPRQGDRRFDCRGEFNGLALNERFVHYLPDKAGKLYRQLNLNGKIDGNFQFVYKANGNVSQASGLWYSDHNQDLEKASAPIIKDDLWDRSEYKIKFKLRDGQMKYDKFPYPLRDVSAKCELTDRQLKINSLKARNGKTTIELSGIIREHNDFGLRLDCCDLTMDEQLVQALPESVREYYKRVEPSGMMNLDLKITRRPDENRVIVHAFYKLLSFAPSGLKELFVLLPRALPWVDLFCPFRANKEKNLPILHRGLVITRDLHRWLVITRDLHRGLLTTHEQLQNRKQDENRNSKWTFQGRADLSNACVRKPMLVENITGGLQGRAEYDEQTRRFSFSAEMLPAALRVMSHPLTDTTCAIDYNGEQKTLTFDRIGSGFCDGRLAGRLEINIDPDQPGYKLALQFLDGNLAELLDRNREPQKKRWVQGKFSGFFNISRSQKTAERRGHFNFIVREAVLGELPLVAQLLHVINLKLPGEGAFNKVGVMGDISGDRVFLGPVHLRGSAVSLTGAGFMQGPFFTHRQDYMPGDSAVAKTYLGACPLEMVLFVDAPRYLPEIPVLSSFYQAIRGELMQVRVSGSFDNPKVEPIAFPTLGDALRYLEKGGKSNPNHN